MPPLQLAPRQLDDFRNRDWRNTFLLFSQGRCPCCTDTSIHFSRFTTSDSFPRIIVDCSSCGWSSRELRDFLDAYSQGQGNITQAKLSAHVLMQPIVDAHSALRRHLKECCYEDAMVENGPLTLRLQRTARKQLSWSLVEEHLGQDLMQQLQESVPKENYSYVQVFPRE